jgi:hypothetical protein
MNRANLRCLGLSVGIAIALAGCKADQLGASEDYSVPYSTQDRVRALAAREGPIGSMARVALADGTLMQSESSTVIAESEQYLSGDAQ